jgi:hypothetical protein
MGNPDQGRMPEGLAMTLMEIRVLLLRHSSYAQSKLPELVAHNLAASVTHP